MPARHVASHRHRLTPCAQPAQYGVARGREDTAALYAQVGRLGTAVGGMNSALVRELFLQPGGASHPVQFHGQMPIQGQQVQHVELGVVQLGGTERTFEPVGACFSLLQGDVQQRLHQLPVSERESVAGKRGGKLGVEDPTWRGPGHDLQHLEVLGARVHDDKNRGVGQHLHEGAEVGDLRRIDEEHTLRVGHLHECRMRMVGTFLYELRVEPDESRVGPPLTGRRETCIARNHDRSGNGRRSRHIGSLT